MPQRNSNNPRPCDPALKRGETVDDEPDIDNETHVEIRVGLKPPVDLKNPYAAL